MLIPITANITGPARNGRAEGKDYSIFPVKMLREGVLNGSNGPTFYPLDEITKWCSSWDLKPIVVNHPQKDGEYVSAASPEILDSYKVGFVLANKIEGQFQQAEAWIDKDRASSVDNRIIDMISANAGMEVSTGLFADFELSEGEYESKPYIQIARNFRPDHLALLPDMVGACSIADGCGLSVNSKLSYEDLRQVLNGLIRKDIPDEHYIWIADIFDNFFVYEKQGSLFKQDYEITKNTVKVSGTPVKVHRVSQFRTEDGTLVNEGKQSTAPTANCGCGCGGKVNKCSKESSMKITPEKKAKVDKLISANNDWTEDDRPQLEAMEESLLDKLAKMGTPTGNADEKKGEKPGPGTEPNVQEPGKATPVDPPAKDNPANPPGTVQNLSFDEWMKSAPPEFQGMVANGINAYNQQRKQMITSILANEANQFTEDELNKFSQGQLYKLATMADAMNSNKKQQESHEVVPFYAGPGASPHVVNAMTDEEPLALPIMEFPKQQTA